MSAFAIIFSLILGAVAIYVLYRIFKPKSKSDYIPKRDFREDYYKKSQALGYSSPYGAGRLNSAREPKSQGRGGQVVASDEERRRRLREGWDRTTREEHRVRNSDLDLLNTVSAMNLINETPAEEPKEYGGGGSFGGGGSSESWGNDSSSSSDYSSSSSDSSSYDSGSSSDSGGGSFGD
jgi:hypothetical protein